MYLIIFILCYPLPPRPVFPHMLTLPIHLLIYFLYYSPPSLISAVPGLIGVGPLTGSCVTS